MTEAKIKVKTLMFVGMFPTPEEVQWGRSHAAQFRNYRLIDPEAPAEPCDYIAGSVVPQSYTDFEFHPEWPVEGLEGASSDLGGGVAAPGPDKAPGGANNGPGGAEDQVIPEEISLEWLKSAPVKLLVKLAREEEVTIPKKAKPEQIVELLAQHFELEEEEQE